MPLHENVLTKKGFAKRCTDFTVADIMYIGDTGAFYFDNISAEDVM